MSTSSTSSPQLTLNDLLGALARLLADGYRGAPSGRIRDLPDVRTVRWYQTTGLIDRPLEYRGSTALFGRKHVLQLAAIKQLQAAGFPLAEIQQGLAGKTDAELAKAAAVTVKAADTAITEIASATTAASKQRFEAAVAGSPATSRRKTAFWDGGSSDGSSARESSDTHPSAPVESNVTGMQSVPLGDSAMLVWRGKPLADVDKVELFRLAKPLIALLQGDRSSAKPAASAKQSKKQARSLKRV